MEDAILDKQFVKEEQKESIKLFKNETSRGIISYAWEIKILWAKVDSDALVIARLKKLNERLKEEFVSEGGSI